MTLYKHVLLSYPLPPQLLLTLTNAQQVEATRSHKLLQILLAFLRALPGFIAVRLTVKLESKFGHCKHCEAKSTTLSAK